MKSGVDALQVHRPDGGGNALVFDSPHSGTFYPDDFGHTAPRELVRQAEDTYVAELFGAAPAHGATLLEALFPRAYIDANRALTDLDPELLDRPWPEPLERGPKTRLGIGLIWRLARGGAPMYDRKLAHAEVRRRIETCYRPYHDALDRLIEECHRIFGGVWHLNCHSMPAVGDALSSDPGRERADFVIGDRDGTTCDPRFTDLIVGFLRARGFAVAVNDPYKGVEIVRRHGRPHENRHSLQIEINRRLYMDERSLEKTERFAPLKAVIDDLIAVVAADVRERTRGAQRASGRETRARAGGQLV